MLISIVLGANHVAARAAMEHGASVATAAAVRSAFTAVFLLALLRLSGVSLAISRRMSGRTLLLGILVATQSICLFSAVARVPVALALLVFQTFPFLYSLLSWAMGKDRLPRRALLAMPFALAGLALALDVIGASAHGAQHWADLAAGCAFAFAGSVAFSLVMYLTAHWVQGIDGRLRTLYIMIVTTVLVTTGGSAMGALSLPSDMTGWAALATVCVFYGVGITSMFVIVPRLERAASTVALNFEPIAVLGLAWLVLGQAVTPLQILGAFVVVGAIMWTGLEKK